MTKQSWLLVANGSEANIFHYLAEGKVLEEVGGLGNGTRRYKDEDLVTDRPGTMSGGGNNIYGQSSLTPEQSPTDRAKQDFARAIVDELDEARRADKLHSVDIIASPQMLGLLRDSMDSNLKKIVDRTVAKDGSEKNHEELLKMIKKG